jgi:hypothetical protein
MNARLTFLSGDVHLAAVGCLFTHKKTKKLEPEQDHRYMLNIVTSAIVVGLCRGFGDEELITTEHPTSSYPGADGR